jgi:hypothetical protein
MVATTLGSTPDALAFAQDMFLNVPLIADFQAIARTCEHTMSMRIYVGLIGSNVSMTVLRYNKF